MEEVLDRGAVDGLAAEDVEAKAGKRWKAACQAKLKWSDALGVLPVSITRALAFRVIVMCHNGRNEDEKSTRLPPLVHWRLGALLLPAKRG